MDSERRPKDAAAGRRRYEVKLVVDGRPVDLKDFLHDLLGGAIFGLCEGLRGVDDPREVTFEVKRR